MLYRELIPIAPLQPFVRCIWTLRNNRRVGHNVERVPPDGHGELIINRASPFIEWLPDETTRLQPDAFVVGQLSQCMRIQPTGTVDLVGIRFTPSGLARLLRVHAGELTNRYIEVSSISGTLARRLESAATDDDVGLLGVQRALLDLVPKRAHALDLVTAAIDDILATNGRMPVSALCRRLNTSDRHLERRFHQEVGLGPKLFARIVRFNSLLRSSQSTDSLAWADLALQHGYYDQAHLIRDFRRFTGLSPTAYFGADHELSDLISSGRDVGFLQD